MELTKYQKKCLLKQHYDPESIIAPNEQLIKAFIIISNGFKHPHESGYPFIKVLGCTEDRHLVDLGKHDHIAIYDQTINMDSIGTNMFHFWLYKNVRLAKGFFPCSSIGIEKYGIL